MHTANCKKIRTALKPYEKQELPTARIKQIVSKLYPEMPDGSNKPSEHARKTNATPCSCAGTPRRIFDRVKRGLYLVRKFQN